MSEQADVHVTISAALLVEWENNWKEAQARAAIASYETAMWLRKIQAVKLLMAAFAEDAAAEPELAPTERPEGTARGRTVETGVRKGK